MKKIQLINNAKRIVFKIGSSLLIKNEKFNLDWLKTFVEDIDLLKGKKEIVIVASGAVPLGKSYLNYKAEETNITIKQAFAACGQVILMNNFKDVFKKKIAQVLLTFSDTEDRRRSLNSRETLKNLLSSNVIPVINENDTVATDELRFGDNDRLAARVAQIIEADMLILLSDVKGLYDKNPNEFQDAKLIEIVEKIDSKIYKMSTSQTNRYGSGGMNTKIEAAKIAGSFGCSTMIIRGNVNYPLSNLEKENTGTLFISNLKKKKGLKNWLAGAIKISGRLYVDDGAVYALENGASLLPSGVIKTQGKFSKGDIVEIVSYNEKKIGKGIIYYDDNEVEIIKGKKSIFINEILGYEGREEIIHRDYLYLDSK